MKLYYMPGACSLAPHIVAREAGFALDLVKVSMGPQGKTAADGQDFLALNPKGYVPALVLDNGDVLTEGPVIAQFLAEKTADRHLMPPPGAASRYRVLEW